MNSDGWIAAAAVQGLKKQALSRCYYLLVDRVTCVVALNHLHYTRLEHAWSYCLANYTLPLVISPAKDQTGTLRHNKAYRRQLRLDVETRP